MYLYIIRSIIFAEGILPNTACIDKSKNLNYHSIFPQEPPTGMIKVFTKKFINLIVLRSISITNKLT